jgi:hypothetical protein
MQMCGFEELVEPELRLNAYDCGGNVGSDTVQLGGSFRPVAGVCP